MTAAVSAMPAHTTMECAAMECRGTVTEVMADVVDAIMVEVVKTAVKNQAAISG